MCEGNLYLLNYCIEHSVFFGSVCWEVIDKVVRCAIGQVHNAFCTTLGLKIVYSTQVRYPAQISIRLGRLLLRDPNPKSLKIFMHNPPSYPACTLKSSLGGNVLCYFNILLTSISLPIAYITYSFSVENNIIVTTAHWHMTS